MASCDYCGTTIIFGGVKAGGLRFCNENCQNNGASLVLGRSLPKNIVDEQVGMIHRGRCPKCNGSGPVDIHNSYRVYSALVITSHKTISEVCCRSCGTKSQLGSLAFSLILGWWGFPWGIIMTPIQTFRNIAGMVSGPDESRPSEQLESIIRTNIATEIMMNQKIDAINQKVDGAGSSGG